MKQIPIFTGKFIIKLSEITKRGAGSTWPGHVALKIDSKFLKNIFQLNPQLDIVLVAGTNGKTTTAKLLHEALTNQGKKVFRNDTGANLINGVASTLLKKMSISGTIHYDVAIFEVDENSLPLVISELSTIKNDIFLILLNVFRDQLDRYGEVNSIVKKWNNSLKTLPKKTILVVNGDDPMLRFIGENCSLHSFYFGLSERYMTKREAPHDVDFIFCPHCGEELIYSKRSYSHMGIYACPKCDFKHRITATFEELPNPLFGLYNKYNINAAALLLQKGFGADSTLIKKTLEYFLPAFGRQEKIVYNGRNIFLLLSKNPTGFNQSIQAVLTQEKNPNVLLVLNDRIPDGQDISWIWDVDTEELAQTCMNLTISGDRCFDMGLRIKYSSGIQISNSQFKIEEDLNKAINLAVDQIPKDKTLYILATYSAMLDTRKHLKGRAIL